MSAMTAVETEVVEACAVEDPDLMFHADEVARTRPNASLVQDAKRVCLSCSLRTSCLEVALERGEQWGVWGGLTTDERYGVLKDRAAADRRRRRARARAEGQVETLPGV